MMDCTVLNGNKSNINVHQPLVLKLGQQQEYGTAVVKPGEVW